MRLENQNDILVRESEKRKYTVKQSPGETKKTHLFEVKEPNYNWTLSEPQLDYITERMTRGMHGCGQPMPCNPLAAGFTYLGQLIAHDLNPSTSNLDNMDWPIGRANFDAVLELNSVYPDDSVVQPYLEDGDHSVLSHLLDSRGYFELQSVGTDVKGHDFRREAGIAYIPDNRNDENAILSQLHVLWLRIHNHFLSVLLDKCVADNPFENYSRVKKMVVLLFQDVVLHDYLQTLLDPIMLDWSLRAKEAGTSILRWSSDKTDPIPKEFSHAAFRFGHTMVLESYEIQSKPVEIACLVRDSKDHAGLKDSHVIHWTEFFDGVHQGEESVNRASQIDLGYPGAFDSFWDRLNCNLRKIEPSKTVRKVFSKSYWNERKESKLKGSFEQECLQKAKSNSASLDFKNPLEMLKQLARLDIRESKSVLTAGDILESEAFKALPVNVKERILKAYSMVGFHGVEHVIRGSMISVNEGSPERVSNCNAPLILYLLREGKAFWGTERCELLGPLASLIIAEVILASVKRGSVNSLETCKSELKENLGEVLYPIYSEMRSLIKMEGKGFGSLIRELNLQGG